MTTLDELKREIEHIKVRNRSVETDKAWETSLTRKILIGVFTYLTIGAYMYSIGVTQPLLNALIPTAGFLLSTLSLPYIRKYWEKYIYKL